MKDDSTFAQRYLGEFATMEIPLPELLAMEYHIRCEEADKRVTAKRDCFGEAVSCDPRELQEMRANGARVLAEMLREIRAQRLEVSDGEFRRAIREVGHSGMTTKRMELELQAYMERKRSTPQWRHERLRIARILGLTE